MKTFINIYFVGGTSIRRELTRYYSKQNYNDMFMVHTTIKDRYFFVPPDDTIVRHDAITHVTFEEFYEDAADEK